jgi:putative toxin-antitoxin system antitoxin component (TIGR02293 family)
MEAIKLNSQTAINAAIRNLVAKIEKSAGYQVLPRKLTYVDFLKNKMLMIHAIREGISFELFQLIQEQTPFNEEDWAVFLGISTKSLQRHRAKADFVFKPLQSEKILELAEVTQIGKSIFDSEEQFYSWLQLPSFAIGNLKPIELLKDSYGKELVVHEMLKIDQGIFV